MNGVVATYYKNGIMESLVSYKNGTVTGLYRRWYENGVLAEEGTYDCGKKCSLFRRWNEERILESADIFPSTNMDEYTEIEFYPKGGYKRETKYIIVDAKGVIHGIERAWYENGNLYFTCPYNEGKVNGVCVKYYEDGKRWKEETWVKGKRHGPFTTYHKNGLVSVEGTYYHNELDGEYMEWFHDQTLMKSAIYKSGELAYKRVYNQIL
jgi:uncharacterized protein